VRLPQTAGCPIKKTRLPFFAVIPFFVHDRRVFFFFPRLQVHLYLPGDEHGIESIFLIKWFDFRDRLDSVAAIKVNHLLIWSFYDEFPFSPFNAGDTFAASGGLPPQTLGSRPPRTGFHLVGRNELTGFEPCSPNYSPVEGLLLKTLPHSTEEWY